MNTASDTQHVHTEAYDSATKRSSLPTQTAMRANPEHTMLRERSQTQKATCCVTEGIRKVHDGPRPHSSVGTLNPTQLDAGSGQTARCVATQLSARPRVWPLASLTEAQRTI